MFLALTWIPLLFASVTNALQNGALPRHRLGTRLHRPPPHHPHTPSNATFTVDVSCPHARLPDAEPTFDSPQLNIDHFGGAKGTFKNRYWMNDTYYEGGPVFGAQRTTTAGTYINSSSGQSSMWGRPMPSLTITRFSRQVPPASRPDDCLSIPQEVYGYRSNVMALAKEFKGLGILWEHRYYGESLPFQDKFSGTVRCSLRCPSQIL